MLLDVVGCSDSPIRTTTGTVGGGAPGTKLSTTNAAMTGSASTASIVATRLIRIMCSTVPTGGDSRVRGR